MIIPVYNVEAYLKECLDSIFQQDFQDYEIICVNDASTDASGKILSEYEKGYTNFKVIEHMKNLGVSASRNTGLKNANGKYIMFIDPDDMIVLKSFIELYSIAEETQADLVRFNYTMISDKRNLEGDFSSDRVYHYDGIYSGKDLFCLFVENQELKTTVWSCFIRKCFLDENKIRFYDGILHEDNLFTFLCMMEAKRAINIDKKYYIYRKRKGSIMDTYSAQRALSYFVIMIQVLTYWNSHSFSERENKAIEYYFRDLYTKYLRMSWFEGIHEELKIGGYVEKTVYSVLYGKYKRRWLTLNKDHLKEIRKADNVIVFGAGMGSMDIIDILSEQDVKVNLIAVSDTRCNPKSFCGIKVEGIDNIITYMKNAIIIIGVKKEHRSGIYDELKQLGCSNIILPESITDVKSQ